MTFIKFAYFYRFPDVIVLGPQSVAVGAGRFYAQPVFLGGTAGFEEIGAEILSALARSRDFGNSDIESIRGDDAILSRLGFKSWAAACKQSTQAVVRDDGAESLTVVPMVKMGRGFGSDDARAIKILRTNVRDIGQALTELTVL